MPITIVFTLTSTFTVFFTNIAQTPIPINNLRHMPETTTTGVVRSIVGDQFILDDGTGQLIVDSDICWNRDNELTVGERVTVVGKYEDYDLDAFRIIRASGEVINNSHEEDEMMYCDR